MKKYEDNHSRDWDSVMRASMYRFIIISLVISLVGCASSSPSPQSLNWTGNEAYFNRNYSDAIKWYTESLEMSRASGEKQFEAISMYGLARANGHLCELNRAEVWLVKSINLRKSLPNLETAYLSQNILELGRLYIAQKKWEKAKEQYLEGLPMLVGLNTEAIDPLGYANLLEEYQQILEKTGDNELANTNLTKIKELRKNNQDKQAQYVSAPYPANCTLNESSQRAAVTAPPS